MSIVSKNAILDTEPQRSALRAPNTRQLSLLAFVQVVVICMIWGFNFVAMKETLQSFPPFFLGGSRFLVAALLFLPFFVLGKIPWPPLKQWLAIASIGLLQVGFMFGFVLYGLQHVPSGAGSLLLYTYPIIMAVIAHFFIPGEKLQVPSIVGLLLGIGGLAVLAGPIAIQATGGHPIYALLIIIGALSWALGTVLFKRLGQSGMKLNVLAVNAGQLFFGGLFLLLLALFFEHPNLHQQLSTTFWWLLVFQILGASAFAYWLWLSLLQRYDANVLSVFLFLVPVFGLLFGFLVRHEHYGLRALSGCLLVVLGIAFVSMRLPKKKSYLTAALHSQTNQS